MVGLKLLAHFGIVCFNNEKVYFCSYNFINFAFGDDNYIDCTHNVNQAELQTQQFIAIEFQALLKELENLKQRYESVLDEYKEQNKLLNSQILLNKEKALKNAELIFLLKKFNESLNVSITAESENEYTNK